MTVEKVDINALTPEQIADLTPEQMADLIGDDGVNNDSQPLADEKAEVQAEVNAESEAKTEKIEAKEQQEQKPQGIATKAGDNIIPYSVLETTREKAAEFEKKAEILAKEKSEAQAQIDEMDKRITALTSGVVDGDNPLSDEEMEALEEDMPEVANAIKAMKAKQANLVAQLQEKNESLQSIKAETVMKTVQEAIDDVPKLAYIQSSSPRLFNMAVEIDNELKQDPALNNLTIVERFTKAVQKLEVELGIEIKLPSQGKTQVTKETKAITSLDDIPNGAPPVSDDLRARLDRSSTELAADFTNMTQKQIDDLLNQASKYL